MKAVSLKAFNRNQLRRSGAKRLRSAGRIPAVIYGRNIKPQNLELQTKDIEDVLKRSASETILFDLDIQGEQPARELALLQEVQHHPLSGGVLHVDFHQVSAEEKVTVMVPVETTGTAAGVKLGGVLEHVLFKVRLRGLPKDLPEVVPVDVSSLEINQTIHLGELVLPEGVEAVGDLKVPVIAVAAPLTEAQEQAAAEEAATPVAQPEMIREKKEAKEAS